MKRKVVWLVLSGLMVAALVLASCKPAVVEEVEEEVEEETAEEAVEEAVEEVAPTVEGPQYGGVLRLALTSGPMHFDEALSNTVTAAPMTVTNEPLILLDWTKGPAGTGEASLLYSIFPDNRSIQTGCLAESWEISDADTFVFQIRKGVHFHNKPPVNGREMTADDVVFSLNLHFFECPTAYQYSAYPGKDNIESITAPDKYTVVVKCFPGRAGIIYEQLVSNIDIVPPEAVEKYGNLNDWRNSVGTGAFMLKDYVSESSIVFGRNPNYWMKDPFYPENQLPYIDGFKMLIVPDMSTRLAALRTGKIDTLMNIPWEDAGNLIDTNPELEYVEFASPLPRTIFMRVDKPELPYYDKRVRHALAMAVDNQEIKNDIYGGRADLFTRPCLNIPEFSDIYTPLEDLPESTRELYDYHPDKAKELLAEAGFPDGFRTEMVCPEVLSDTAELIAAYWKKIGVDVEIDLREYSTWRSIGYSKATKEMIIWVQANYNPYKFLYTRAGNLYNWGCVEDDKILAAYEAAETFHLEQAKRAPLVKEVTPYLLDQCYWIVLPAPHIFNLWQPWVKGYHGEDFVGYYSYFLYTKHIWLDQNLKKEMGH